MTFLVSGDLKTKKKIGPVLRSYHETYGNSFFPMGKFAKKIN